MNVISPKLKFVMKIVFKPITTSALLSDDQKMPTLDSFCYMMSHIGGVTNTYEAQFRNMINICTKYGFDILIISDSYGGQR